MLILGGKIALKAVICMIFCYIFLDNGVMTTPKRGILSLVFTALCFKKSVLIWCKLVPFLLKEILESFRHQTSRDLIYIYHLAKHDKICKPISLSIRFSQNLHSISCCCRCRKLALVLQIA